MAVPSGQLRVYLGAAPGVGKTYAMLEEAHRRRARGTDVVVGFVETHGRARTAARLGGLPVVPRLACSYRGTTVEELDVDAVVARRPAVVLVDELAHTNAPGSVHDKRWQDVEQLLAAGLDVITTVNIQQLESLEDVVTRISGVRPTETVPDAVVRRADQIELVDMSPEALRRRLAHGNVYPPERVDAALAHYFRPRNLAALRELALLWLADRVEDELHHHLAEHGADATWETRERVVVALSGAPGGDHLVRRARRMATRLRGQLVAVHVVLGDGLARDGTDRELEHQRTLVTEVGGTYREVVGDDVATALIDFATAERATQVLLGGSHQSRWQRITRGSIVDRVARATGPFDVHVISAEPPANAGARPLPRGAPRRAVARLPWRRQLAGAVVAVAGLPLLTVLLLPWREQLTLPTDFLLYLAFTVAVSVLGGLAVGVATAIVASILVNWFFVPPLHEFTIRDGQNVVALAVFIAVAALVSLLVDRASARTRESRRARVEAEVLARATATLVGERDPLPDLLDQVRTTFAYESASVLSRRGAAWSVDVSAGVDPPAVPADGEAWDLVGSGTTVLVLRGGQRPPRDQRVLRSFLAQLSVALQRRQLQAAANDAAQVAAADALRAALLQAVSHDLRTPLATIKAAASSLLQPDVQWSAGEGREFAHSIEEEADRLNRVVGNLLDMSRLQAGALAVDRRPAYVDEVVSGALASIGDPKGVDVVIPESVPAVQADPALLERAVANIVANAVAWSRQGDPVRVESGVVGDRVHLRVVDLGPGIATADREVVFEPFRRLGDRSTQAGAGLGLAVARGFVRAQDGDLWLEDTPGGGLTVVIDLPRSEAP